MEKSGTDIEEHAFGYRIKTITAMTFSICHLDSFGLNGVSHTDIMSYKKDGNSVCKETIWYTDGRVISKITTLYPDGHSETKTQNLVQRCGLAVDLDISNEEFAKLKESRRGIIADEVLDGED